MLWVVVCLLGVVWGQDVAVDTQTPLQLKKLSQLYLPYDFEDAQAQFCYGQGSAMASLYQPEDQLVYVIGKNKWLQIADITDVLNPKLFYRENINTIGTAIGRCEGLVAVSTLNFWNPSGLGNVLIYSQFDPKEQQLTWRYNLTVGPTPVDIAFTPDCSKLIVANQGLHGLDRGNFYNNPQASISIIDFPSLKEQLTPQEAQNLVTSINFTQFDEQAEQLVAEGVRWVYRGESTPDSIGKESLSHDLEPSQLVMPENGFTVYVFMQKNNAVAEIDLSTGEILQLLPLGTKSFSTSAFDPSSVDGGAALATYPVSGLYQPQMVVPINDTDGTVYFISVNTGMETQMNKEINGVFKPFQDWIKGIELAEDFEDSELVDLLSNTKKLGDMKFSVVDEGLVTFGGRGFSVWKIPDFEMVYDSGYLLEQRHKTHLLSAYNSVPADAFCGSDEEYADLAPTAEEMIAEIIEMNTEEITTLELLDDLEELDLGPQMESIYENVSESIYLGPDALVKGPGDYQDMTSNSVGPQPNALAVGSVNGTRVMVMSTKGSSSLFLFDITDPTNPIWLSIAHFGDIQGTYYQLYQTTSLGDVAPSSINFIPDEISPTGQPLVIVTGEMSGTLSLYSFEKMQAPNYLQKAAPSKPANLVTSTSFPSQSLNQTKEVKNRAAIMDMTNGICVDVSPDDEFTCAQQASFGKCSEQFMVERNFCARTCKRLPCNQGGIVESVMSVKNASLLTVNSFMFPENIQETLEQGILQGYQCVGRSDMEVCLQTPAFFSGLAGPIDFDFEKEIAENGDEQDSEILSFIGISDRGPNQDCEDLLKSGIATASETGKAFPVPDFSPFISKIQFDKEEETVVVEQTCYLKGTDGSLVSGIPNTKNDDLPFSKDCQSPLEFDPSGVDPEDIFPIANSGLCLTVEEYSPSVLVIDCDFSDLESCGTIKARYTPEGTTLQGASYPVQDTLPEIYTQRRKNRGFEGIAVSPDGGIAYVFLQSPMGDDEDSKYQNTSVIRIIELDVSDPMDIQVVGEYLYLGDEPEKWSVESNEATNLKLSGALWLGDSDSDDVLVVERATGQLKLYVVNFANATNVYEMEESASLYWESENNLWEIGTSVYPVEKTLLLDSSQVEGWDEESVSYKQEGVGLINDCTVVLGADNDFGLDKNGASQATVIRMQHCISQIINQSQ